MIILTYLNADFALNVIKGLNFSYLQQSIEVRGEIVEDSVIAIAMLDRL